MNQSLDPIIVATLIASNIFGPALASVIGPYAVIVAAATLGAAIGLGRRDQSTRSDALMFYIRMVCMAILFTVPLADMARVYLKLEEARWMLSPIAAIIGGIGNSWPAVGAWLFSAAGRFVDAMINLRKGDPK